MFYYTFRLVKLSALWVDFIFLSILLYVLSLLPGNVHGNWYFRLFRVWCKAFVRALDVNLKLHQKNLQDIPRRYILIANHPSAFEDIGIPALFEVRSLAKIEVKDWWIVGKISSAAGNLYVKRESRESRNQASESLVQAIKDGTNVALYPEGGCKGKRIFESFRYGAFDVSMKTGVPILPVFLHYEAQDDFEWRDPHTLLDKLYHFLNTENSTANYYVFDAIDPANFTSKEEFTEYTWQLYKNWQEKYME
ncbi:MAG TPA: 1-acyl-sn-glycerol-3-phosphate acyltransferase [Gammaproteobacteria bacterium]|nr:1-acyl-sn-glycerol-3-phosphate acyltransferase [Gammaproteobacteria bacterium]